MLLHQPCSDPSVGQPDSTWLRDETYRPVRSLNSKSKRIRSTPYCMPQRTSRLYDPQKVDILPETVNLPQTRREVYI